MKKINNLLTGDLNGCQTYLKIDIFDKCDDEGKEWSGVWQKFNFSLGHGEDFSQFKFDCFYGNCSFFPLPIISQGFHLMLLEKSK